MSSAAGVVALVGEVITLRRGVLNQLREGQLLGLGQGAVRGGGERVERGLGEGGVRGDDGVPDGFAARQDVYFCAGPGS